MYVRSQEVRILQEEKTKGPESHVHARTALLPATASPRERAKAPAAVGLVPACTQDDPFLVHRARVGAVLARASLPLVLCSCVSLTSVSVRFLGHSLYSAGGLGAHRRIHLGELADQHRGVMRGGQRELELKRLLGAVHGCTWPG